MNQKIANRRRFNNHGNNGNGRGNGRLEYGSASNGKNIQQLVHNRDKYLKLANEAAIGGDRVAAERHLQHAEHFTKMIAANGIKNQNNQNDRRRNFRAESTPAEAAETASESEAQTTPQLEEESEAQTSNKRERSKAYKPRFRRKPSSAELGEQSQVPLE